ncbi:MAG: chemotaxis protein CheB, partial [Deltaproteobacteria bacterium]
MAKKQPPGSAKKARRKPKASTIKSPRKRPSSTKTEKTSENASYSPEFPIVAIGASAGGLEAFEEFFSHMPSDSGIAFVLIQHLDPSHKSMLAELVSRFTQMDVVEIEEGMKVEPNRVHVIPPNYYLAIFHGRLQLFDASEVPGIRTPIDHFFRSLAEDQQERSIGIILSGSGTEGAFGVRTIKGAGGMVMAQDPHTAKYDGMPRNAVTTGLVDFVLPVKEMPDQLMGYVDHAHSRWTSPPDRRPAKTAGLLEKVFNIVRSQTGQDFTHYKQNTVLRRIDRRMAINQIPSLEQYIGYLQMKPDEVKTLLKELLIGVTNFFRDPQAFDIIQQKVLPLLLKDRPHHMPLRIWVTGCATGEEAYSLAIACRETMDELKVDYEVQIFATDIDRDSVQFARSGLYPNSIAADVTPERLERFFTEQDSFFQLRRDLREWVIFAEQNAASDPPFSNLDLITCRNLLIYLGSELQKKLIALFHYALRKDGFLFLGPSETVGQFSNLFTVVDRKWKVFKRKETESSVGDLLELRH